MEIRLRTAVLCLALLIASVACGSGSQPTGVQAVSAEELATAIAGGDAPFVLDVRSEAEFAAGHIPGAVNVPHDQLAGRLGELPSDRDAEVIVHCQSGRRATAAESVLTNAGFTDVRDLSGHMAGWREGNHPVE